MARYGPKDATPEFMREWGPRVAKLRADGMSLEATAQRLGLSYHRARRIDQENRKQAALDDIDAPTEEVDDDESTEWAHPMGDFAFEDLGDEAKVWSRKGSPITTIEQLLDVAEIDRTIWRPYAGTVNAWTQAAKIRKDRIVEVNGEERVVKHDEIVETSLPQVRVRLERRPELAELQPPEPSRLFDAPPMPAPKGATATRVLIVPDMQAGFRWRNKHTELEPLHDRGVLDSALQYAAQTQPDLIHFTGDNIDWACLSLKYRTHPDYRGADRPMLWALHWWLAQFRAACPDSVIIYTEGNHEDRVKRYLLERGAEMIQLFWPVGETPDFARIVPRLLRLDELGIQYIAPYGEPYYLWNRIQLIHGTTVKAQPGATSAHYLGKHDISTVMGHIHRCEIVHGTVWSAEGRRGTVAMSPGCACRLKPGLVPAMKHRNDWQQGVGELFYWADEDVVTGQIHRYEGGALRVDGRCIKPRERTEEVAAFSGYPQIAKWKEDAP